MTQLELKYIPLSQAATWDRNPKKHDLESIAQSIAAHGFKDPPKFEPALNAGSGGLVEGNGRAKALAAMRAGGQEPPLGVALDPETGEWLVPVLFGVVAPSQAIAEQYALDHNNLVLAGGDYTADEIARLWDDSAYRDLLTELADQGAMPVSVDEADLAALLGGPPPVPEPGDGGDEFEPDEAASCRVQAGDIWLIGRAHRLMCGDCTNPAVVARLMQGKRADAVVTDSPYGINREGITNDDPEGLSNLFHRLLAVLPVTDAAIVNFQSPRLLPVWLDAVRHAGHTFERLLWMYKPNDVTFPWRGWLLTSEAIAVSSVGKPRWQDIHPYAHDVYSTTGLGKELPPDTGNHASVKPLAIVTDLMRRVCPPGGLVFEPFLGSGTGVVAAHRAGATCYGCEIEPRYVEVCLQRAEAEGLTVERIESTE